MTTEPAATGQRSDIPAEVHQAAVAALRTHFGSYNIGRSLAGSLAEVVVPAVADLLVQAGREAAARETPAYVFDLIDAWQTGRPLDFHGHPVPEDVQARLARGTHQEGGGHG